MKNLSYKDKKDAELLQVIAVFKGNEAAVAHVGTGVSPEAVMQASSGLCERLLPKVKGSGRVRAKNGSKD